MYLLLEGIYRLTINQANKVINEGYNSLPKFIYWSHEDVRRWCVEKTKLPPTRGGCSFGNPRIKNTQVLACWATDLQKRGIDLIPEDFTTTIILEYKQLSLESRN